MTIFVEFTPLENIDGRSVFDLCSEKPENWLPKLHCRVTFDYYTSCIALLSISLRLYLSNVLIFAQSASDEIASTLQTKPISQSFAFG